MDSEAAGTIPPLPPRNPAGHKGDFGTVAVVGGSALRGARMFGAPALTARAALRAGCGLVRLAMPEPLLDLGLLLTESATGVALPVDSDGDLVAHESAGVFDALADSVHAIALGVGMGTGDGARSLVLRAMLQTDAPVIADADALNLLASTPDFARDIRAAAVLTPHPGEFHRLAKPLRITASPTEAKSRPAAAEAMAQRLGCIVVLKGAGTVVSDGYRTWTCDRGHPCLATAGTGDVLTGLIAGLVAQFVARTPSTVGNVRVPRPPGKPLDLYDAARAGVEAHAIAAELWAEHAAADAGMLARELADTLPTVITAMRE